MPSKFDLRVLCGSVRKRGTAKVTIAIAIANNENLEPIVVANSGFGKGTVMKEFNRTRAQSMGRYSCS